MPDLPVPTRISARQIGERVRLSWPGHPRRRVVTIGATVFAVSVGLLIAFCAVAILLSTADPRDVRGVAILLGPLAACAGLGVILSLRMRSLLCEQVDLDRDCLWYAPPLGVAETSSLMGFDEDALRLGLRVFGIVRDLGSLWRPRTRARIARSSIAEVRLEGRGRFEHVTVQVGRRDLDIAAHATQADRRWLREVLDRWRRREG